MTGVVLAAGFGRRMMPITSRRAKPSLPVRGIPCVRRAVEEMKKAAGPVMVNLHHLPYTVVKSLEGLDVFFSLEGEILGTAGGVKRMVELLTPPDGVVVCNGDTFFPFSSIVSSFAADSITMVVGPNRNPDRYSSVSLSGDRLVVGEGELMFLGVMGIPGEFLRLLPEKGCLVRDFILKLNLPVKFFFWEDEVLELTEPEDLLRLNLEGELFVEEGGGVEGGAELEEVVVLRDGYVEEGARLRRCIVVSGRVRGGEDLENCIYIDGKVYKLR